MKIKNLDELSRNDLRKAGLVIAEAGLQAVDTKAAIKRVVYLNGKELNLAGEKFTLNIKKRIFVAGIGKCSLDAAEALEEILGEYIYKGMVIDMRCNPELKHIKSCEGDHPFPSQRNVDLTDEMLLMLKGVTEEDIIIMIISGGGSTMLCNPVNFTCVDESKIIECLFRGGATIQEINTLRKHLSGARGGGLAKAAYPAQVVSLIFSDVVGNNISLIASGPTVVDETTIDDAKKIIEKYHVSDKCGFDCKLLIETPKEEKYFANVHNIMIVSNEIALAAMKKRAEDLQFKVRICTNCLSGEASFKGVQIARELHHSPSNSVLLYAGETIVRIRGIGKGGRNQELVLGALTRIEKNECLLSIASDGKDNTESAGAICDMLSKEQLAKKNINPQDFLRENNSFPFFAELGDHIITGPTGSNVADFVIALKR